MKVTILDAIGSPLVRVRSPDGATIAAKLEAFNPGGSAKDRPALAMVEAAERAGDISPGDCLVEPTSGNTGIGLAMVASARGYDLTLVMPEYVSKERKQLLAAYGANIDLVDGDISDARERAEELAEERDAFRLRQFENPANTDSHYRTTAPEILDELDGRTIDAFVAAVGTGGTITGTATRLKEEFPEMEVIAVEPEENAVLSGEEPGEDDYQGMGPGFVSDLLNTDLLDDVETVSIEAAEAESRRLAREEGILVGQSSGAVSVAATRVAERLANPEMDCPQAPAAAKGMAVTSDGGEEAGYEDCPLVVTIFADSGERYLSAGVFDEP